jgi:hypothetical protein
VLGAGGSVDGVAFMAVRSLRVARSVNIQSISHDFAVLSSDVLGCFRTMAHLSPERAAHSHRARR